MTTDLHAAAERLVKFNDEYGYTYCYPDEDGVAVARWALPLLDERKIDEAYLRELGFSVEFEEETNVRELRLAIDDSRWLSLAIPCSQLGWACCIEGDSNYASLPDQKTRGQIAMLLLALGDGGAKASDVFFE
jgi:hypothetical protein